MIFLHPISVRHSSVPSPQSAEKYGRVSYVLVWQPIRVVTAERYGRMEGFLEQSLDSSDKPQPQLRFL